MDGAIPPRYYMSTRRGTCLCSRTFYLYQFAQRIKSWLFSNAARSTVFCRSRMALPWPSNLIFDRYQSKPSPSLLVMFRFNVPPRPILLDEFWDSPQGSILALGYFLKAEKSQVRFHKRSLSFSNYLFLPATLWPLGRFIQQQKWLPRILRG
jgi:hypothetical protein